MPFGLFGKLPQKRDFVAHNLPRAVLEPLESWLQTAVASSRLELGEHWLDLFVVAPIWRFHLGATILGTGAAGSLMPSVDGVGRYFPLALLYVAEPAEALVPPPFDPMPAWYEALEQRLLGVLAEGASGEPAGLVAGLAPPSSAAKPPQPFPEARRRGALWRSEGPAEPLLAALVAAESWVAAAGKSFWWTSPPSGGTLVHIRSGLPEPGFMADMIRGPARG